MTAPNDPINGSTPPDVLARALSGQLAAEAGGDSDYTPDEVVAEPAAEVAAEPVVQAPAVPASTFPSTPAASAR